MRPAWFLLVALLMGCSDPTVALVDRLENGNAEERAAAARTLGDLGQAVSPVARSALRRALSDAEARLEAASALGALGPTARAAVPDLLALVNDSNLMIRSVASWALIQIDAAHPQVKELMRKLEHDPIPLLRKIGKQGRRRGGD